MTRLRRAWAWVSGDQGPLHDDDLVVTRREFRAHCAQEVEALAERDRTIETLEQDCARLTQQVAAENARMARGRAALIRARGELELERANAVALTRVLSHTMEHESRRAACPECHEVEATVAAAQVPS